jgi:hypothetical protein
MKKLFYIAIIFQCAVMAQAWGSHEPFPQFVQDAIKNAPQDALIGIGTAKMATLNMSKTIAATRARADISQQMNTTIETMVVKYRPKGVDPQVKTAFQETITVALSQSTLQGARIAEEDTDDDGNYWVVVILDKTRVVEEINQAVAESKQKIPEMDSFNPEASMDKVLAQVNKASRKKSRLPNTDTAFDKQKSKESGYSE